MTERNPHIDPQPGDQVRSKSGVLRTVIRIDGANCPNPKVIFTAEGNGAAPRREGQWLAYWRLWCKRNAV
jgi:hypothetical protein